LASKSYSIIAYRFDFHKVLLKNLQESKVNKIILLSAAILIPRKVGNRA
jgi:hypothetical protein